MSKFFKTSDFNRILRQMYPNKTLAYSMSKKKYSSNSQQHQNPKNNFKSKFNETSTRFWLLASCAIFGPIFYTLTTPTLPKVEKKKIYVDTSPTVEDSEPAEFTKSKLPEEIVKTSTSKTVIKDTVVDNDGRKEYPYIDYILVGGGTASFNAMISIKNLDPDAKILIIGDEPNSPYQRPPLSKELWENKEQSKDFDFNAWDGTVQSIFYKPESFFEMVPKLSAKTSSEALNLKNVGLLKETRVGKLDLKKSLVVLENGYKIRYGKVLLATGATPKSITALAKLGKNENIQTFRSISDFKKLEEKLNTSNKLLVIGGGFLGSEISFSLQKRNKNEKDNAKTVHILQVFPEKGLLGLLFPEYLSNYLTKKLVEFGVEVKTETKIESVEFNKMSNDFKVTLENLNSKKKEVVQVDQILVSAGVQPNTDLARRSGLEIDPNNGGILVNAELCARTNVFAAGDVCSYYDEVLGRRRIEHYDHAVKSGILAGENMVGLSVRK
ncbi:hypothetical protein HK099_000578 [Clydaea vesicula]|uniref:FAD/NAD(P)-binding domain-containing protein n=1 Tax=Clydaea vesicula TaxID=447962 RepID=A0AAD5TX57_9FUNG|nr:hypothetical protein HK099_000578 [Clydaea vesicula]